MLIDGGTNPGNPGIPMGDGTWVLLGLLVGYMFVLSRSVAKLKTQLKGRIYFYYFNFSPDSHCVSF